MPAVSTIRIRVSELEIEAGPGKFDLMLALLEGKIVQFTLRGVQTPFQVQINKLEIEDGSRQSWNIAGYCWNIQDQVRKENRFEGYYRTDRTVGRMKIFATE